jgi:hypothetical protein
MKLSSIKIDAQTTTKIKIECTSFKSPFDAYLLENDAVDEYEKTINSISPIITAFHTIPISSKGQVDLLNISEIGKYLIVWDSNKGELDHKLG